MLPFRITAKSTLWNTGNRGAIEELEKEFAGEGRVLIRPSGTEPKVRVMIEGKDKERIDKEAHRIADLIQQLML